MIAVSMRTGTSNVVLDLRQFLEMVERDYQLDASDVAGLLRDASKYPDQYPQFGFAGTPAAQDGLLGDDFYAACEQVKDAQDEIRAEIDALRSSKRKGNTKEDIARRLEAIVSNMDYIL